MLVTHRRADVGIKCLRLVTPSQKTSGQGASGFVPVLGRAEAGGGWKGENCVAAKDKTRL